MCTWLKWNQSLAAQVSRVEVKSTAGSWQNTILGPTQRYIGSGGGYSSGFDGGSWRYR